MVGPFLGRSSQPSSVSSPSSSCAVANQESREGNILDALGNAFGGKKVQQQRVNNIVSRSPKRGPVVPDQKSLSLFPWEKKESRHGNEARKPHQEDGNLFAHVGRLGENLSKAFAGGVGVHVEVARSRTSQSEAMPVVEVEGGIELFGQRLFGREDHAKAVAMQIPNAETLRDRGGSGKYGQMQPLFGRIRMPWEGEEQHFHSREAPSSQPCSLPQRRERGEERPTWHFFGQIGSPPHAQAVAGSVEEEFHTGQVPFKKKLETDKRDGVPATPPSSAGQVLEGIMKRGQAIKKAASSAASSAGNSFNQLVADTPRSIGGVPFGSPRFCQDKEGTPSAPGSAKETSPGLGSVRDSLPPIRTKLPSEPQATASHVLKSLDSLYTSNVAKRVEMLQTTLQQVSLKELLEGLQNLAQARKAGDEPPLYPDRRRLSSVQDFFRYAEAEGRRLFDELDFDCDGQVNLQDLEHAMRKRRLPKHYAREMLRRARGHWLASSFGWQEFQALMEQKEPSLLRAFTSLHISDKGTLRKEQILSSLSKAGLPATEDNARAMMRFLDADGDKGQVTYGQFRNFLLLLPPERISTADPSMVWFEAATVVPMAPPATGGANVLRSALAGGLASGLSTCMMHPLDTIKTRVQASSVTLSEVVASVPKMGLSGLYKGATPAILGQFASHGLRTGMFEATRMLLKNVNPQLNEYQIQPVASLCSTVLGTAIRIPCEVLKQRLQAGMFDSVPSALRGTLREDGVRGLFRGTTATLLREVPFYVFGMLIYLQVKNATKSVLKRDLAPWETLLLGGVSGGLAAVAITPFDVLKTRMMIAPKGSPTGILNVGMGIVAREGVGALYKGALPRFFWIAPLGAMNFAGYELAKQAMEEEDA